MNWARWEFTRDNNNPPWAMDDRHVEMVAAALFHLPIDSAFEIGLLNGRSTVAFVEAAERRDAENCDQFDQLSFYDINFTVAAKQVISRIPNCVETQIMTFEACYGMETDFMIKSHDLWMIDGDHDYGAVKNDIAFATECGAKVLVLHDSHHKDFPGIGKAIEEFRSEHKWGFAHADFAERPREQTHRGITFLAKKAFPRDLIEEWNLILNVFSTELPPL